MNDLFTAYAMILISAFVALLFAFLYLTFLKYCAGNLVVGFILILVAGGVLMSIGLLQRAQQIADSGIQKVCVSDSIRSSNSTLALFLARC